MPSTLPSEREGERTSKINIIDIEVFVYFFILFASVQLLASVLPMLPVFHVLAFALALLLLFRLAFLNIRNQLGHLAQQGSHEQRRPDAERHQVQQSRLLVDR